MTENPSLPENLDHLTAWQLREHLIQLTVELADELMVGDPDRLLALKTLYQTTLLALRQRGGPQS